jgi:hypothetical protein
MKKILVIIFLGTFAMGGSAIAQKWEDLSNEQKMSKLQDFRDDNQKYLKGLGLTDDQLKDVDNVNICFLSNLDRIDRYGGDEASKKKYAKSAVAARSAQLDAIIGADKRKQYIEYVQGKLEKAAAIK